MDWIQFFDDHSIPYVRGGKNTKRGEASVRCPWCGDDDPSQHLGVSLTTENWGCLRNGAHRGHSPYRLISGLAGCDFDAAKALARAYSASNAETLGQALATLTATSEPPKPVVYEVAEYPPESRAIRATGITGRFWRYLASRHFDDVERLVGTYGLRCCLTGQWKDRVIIPLFNEGELLGWTARAIQPTINAPRYLSSSQVVKKIIFNEDKLRAGGDLLFVVEGPFDALKLDYYGAPATCLFGASISMDQIYALNQLRKVFKKVVILLDKDAIEQAFAVSDWLQAPNVVIGALPWGAKDPGEI